MRLLIIDDEEDICDLIAEIGERRGLEPRTTSNAEKVDQILSEFTPDVIMMDLMMPGTDGVELLRLLSEKAKSAKLCLISGSEARVLNSARRDGLVQNSDNSVAQGGDFPLGTGACRAQRRDACTKQRLAGVNIADPDNELLIEQGGLDRRGAAFEQVVQTGGGKGGRQWFDAEMRQQFMGGQLIAAHQIANAEAARVIEARLKAVVEGKADMVVFADGRGVGRQHHAPRHAKVQKQRVIVVEHHKDIFGAAGYAQNFAAL